MEKDYLQEVKRIVIISGGDGKLLRSSMDARNRAVIIKSNISTAVVNSFWQEIEKWTKEDTRERLWIEY